MEYTIWCKYFSIENKYVEIGKMKLPDKPRAGETIFIETKEGPKAFVVTETIRQFYADGDRAEVLSSDIYVFEVKYSPDEIKGDDLKTEGV